MQAIPLLEADEDVAKLGSQRLRGTPRQTEIEREPASVSHKPLPPAKQLKQLCQLLGVYTSLKTTGHGTAICLLRYAWFSYFKDEWAHPIVPSLPLIELAEGVPFEGHKL